MAHSLNRSFFWFKRAGRRNTNMKGHIIMSVSIIQIIEYSPLTTIHFMSSINHSELFVAKRGRGINDFWYCKPKTISVIIVGEPPAKPPLRLNGGLAGDVEP